MIIERRVVVGKRRMWIFFPRAKLLGDPYEKFKSTIRCTLFKMSVNTIQNTTRKKSTEPWFVFPSESTNMHKTHKTHWTNPNFSGHLDGFGTWKTAIFESVPISEGYTHNTTQNLGMKSNPGSIKTSPFRRRSYESSTSSWLRRI